MKQLFVESSDLLFTYFKRQKYKMSLLAILLFGSTGIQLLIPQVLREFIDTARIGVDQEELIDIAILFLVITIGYQGLSISSIYMSELVGWNATNDLRRNLIKHCLDLNMSFHNERTPGELIERIDGDVATLFGFFSQFIIRVCFSVFLIVGVLILLFYEDWRIGMVFTGYIILATVILYLSRSIAVPFWKTERQQNAMFLGLLAERCIGLVDIRSNGLQDYVINKFHEHMRYVFTSGRKAWVMNSVMRLCITGFLTIGTLFALLFGAYLYDIGTITIGVVYMLFHYSQMLRRPLVHITYQMQDLQKAQASIARVREIVEIQNPVFNGTITSLPSGPLSVEFNDVSFAYNEKTVLNNLSFKVSPGQVVGIVGRSGSGKTTITRLVSRLYVAQKGLIRVSNVDIQDLHSEVLAQRIGIVTQDVQLIRATVRNNVSFFNSNVSDEKITEAMCELGIDGWLDSLPKGLDTMLEPNGQGLSGGEAQLLAFMRIYLKEPSLVILDEASSRIDPSTEHMLDQAISRLISNRSCIIIAHRPRTLLRCDSILMIEDGYVRENWTQKEWLENPTSHFSLLLREEL